MEMPFKALEHLSILIPVLLLIGSPFVFGIIHHVTWYYEGKKVPPDLDALKKEAFYRNMGYVGSALILITVLFFLAIYEQNNSNPKAIATDLPEETSIPSEVPQAELNVDGYYVTNAIVSNGSYSGYINKDTGKPNGKGRMEYEDGDTYDGEWVEGVRDGNGTMYYENGDVYVGLWKNGMRNGHGIYTWVDGKSYDGDYLDGKRNGDGTFTGWIDEDTGTTCIYIGSSIDDKFNGIGEFQYIDGSKFVGEFKDNRRWVGVYTLSDGTEIEIINGEHK